jgi:hypothetical protein
LSLRLRAEKTLPAGVLDEFGDLRSEEAPEPGDALRSLLGQGELDRAWRQLFPATT